ncbi:MAG: aldo/keto reductase [Pseudomonadota bacterium]
MTRPLNCSDGSSLSAFAFGAMQFGGRADARASQEMFEQCRDAGINHFDTAYAYTDGQSERLLGQFVQSGREQMLVATKVGYVGGAGAANIRAQFDVSRQRLQLDFVDILYLHRFDPDTDLAETMECFAALKDAGATRHIGVSNFAAWQVMKAASIAETFGLTIDVLQPMYNLVKRQAEVEILPMCADQGIAVAAYSPLGGGLLTGKYTHGDSGRLHDDPRYAARYGQTWMGDVAAGLCDLAAELNTDPATLAVAWVAASSYCPTPIISARSTDQLQPSLRAMGTEIGPQLYARLSALSPTPPPATDRIEEQE